MFYRDHYTQHYGYYHYNSRPYCDDLLIYELMTSRDRYRNERANRLYDVDSCNPAYGNYLCKSRYINIA